MQTLEFQDQEIEILRDIARHHLHELDVEVLHTDTHGFKEMLKRRRAVLETILQKVSAAEVSS